MKVAILGAWHVHANDYTYSAKALGEVVGIYDEDARRRSEFAKKFEIAEFSSFEELIESEAEGVIVCTATCEHARYMVRIAESKKNIFTEKVLAFTEEECQHVQEAIVKNGVNFTISLPWKFHAGPLTVKKAIDEGKIGSINYLRLRNCHNGSLAHWLPAHFYKREECGGGAMIDLGAHGMYLADWILGEPVTYNSTFTHFCRDELDKKYNQDGVEDHAVTVMGYPSGAIAINETGFVSVGSPAVFEVGGDRGHLICCDGKVTWYDNKGGMEALELCEGQDLPIESFMKGNMAEGCGIEEAIRLTKMMDGAYKNAR